MHTFKQLYARFKYTHTEVISCTLQLGRTTVRYFSDHGCVTRGSEQSAAPENIAVLRNPAWLAVCAFSSLVSGWFILHFAQLTCALSEREPDMLKAALILITMSSKNSCAYSVTTLPSPASPFLAQMFSQLRGYCSSSSLASISSPQDWVSQVSSQINSRIGAFWQPQLPAKTTERKWK